MANRRYTREFSYTRPIMYQGEWYPSADTVVSDGNGVERKGRMFVDSNGNYFTLDENGNAMEAMPVENLDEVIIKPSNQEMLANAFNNYLTMSNDKARVGNVPHGKYNTHLTENVLSGAKAHAAWDKEHPNLSAWRDAATAVPFAVAAAPVVLGAGEAMAGTAVGQAARNGLIALMSNPIVDAANTTLGLGFAGKGAYDVSQGEFTPSTAMDLAGGVGLLGKGLLSAKANKLNATSSVEDKGLSNFSTLYPLQGKTKIPSDIKREAAQKYTDFINSEEYFNRLKNAGLEDRWQYMKDLTDRRVNGKNNFPGKVRKIIGDNPLVEGRSTISPFSFNYGIALKEDLPTEKITPTLMHEISHWATGNAGVDDGENMFLFPFLFRKNTNYMGDIMRYNESIVPNIPFSKAVHNINKPTLEEKFKTYQYLTDAQEKRARAMSIYQQAKDSNMSIDDFIDKYTRNGKIAVYAPGYLKSMGKILSVDDIKKYVKNFLGVSAPIGVAASLTLNNEQNEYNR